MSKKKSIISYEKMSIEQKKALLVAYPDGFAGNTSKMVNPISGEEFDSLLWETEEIIYLVKLPKISFKTPSVEEDEEEFEEDFDKFDGKEDGEEDASNSDDEEEEDSYGDKEEADTEPSEDEDE